MKQTIFLTQLICISLCTSLSYSMDITTEQKTIKPYAIIDLFTLKKKLKDNGSYANTLALTSLALAPQGKKLIIGTKGSISCLTLQAPHQLKWLFKHPNVQHTPLVTLAQPYRDAPLLIGSAGNYFNTNTQQWHSHLAIYKSDEQFEDGEYIKTHDFHWPIQSLKFNESGKFLAIGGKSFIYLYNITTGTLVGTAFAPETANTNILIDLAINNKGTKIIATREQATLECFTIHNETKAHHTNTTYSLFVFHNIHTPQKGILIGSTNSNAAQIMNTTTMRTTQSTISKSHPFSNENNYEQTTLNSGWLLASAHWTKNKKSSKKNRYSIMVTATNNDCSPQNDLPNALTEQFILNAPRYDETYTTITNTGQLTEEKEHFLAVTFCKKHLIAFNNCGKIFLWELPFSEPTRKNLQEKIAEEKKYPRRTNSSLIKREQTNSSTENDDSIAPTSPATIHNSFDAVRQTTSIEESETLTLSKKKTKPLDVIKKFSSEPRIPFRKKNSSRTMSSSTKVSPRENSTLQESPRIKITPKESPRLNCEPTTSRSAPENTEKK